jgi:uncharacterized sodium:solute symporter family permease YidK
VTHFYPNKNPFQPTDKGVVEIEEWKHTKAFSSFLVILIVGIYIWLGWLI